MSIQVIKKEDQADGNFNNGEILEKKPKNHPDIKPSTISNINELKNKTHDMYSFYQIYKSLAFSDFQQRLPNIQIIKDIASRELMSLKVPLAIIYSEYETFNNDAKSNQLIVKNSNNQFERIESNLDVFDHHSILSAAALKPLQRGSEVFFELPSNLFFNTTEKIISTEDKLAPFTDEKLAEILGKDEYHIARRTVAKYREQLGIRPAKLRRSL